MFNLTQNIYKKALGVFQNRENSENGKKITTNQICGFHHKYKCQLLGAQTTHRNGPILHGNVLSSGFQKVQNYFGGCTET